METKVYAAINAVTAELSKVGIAKSSENTQQHYKFRGIDDVYSVLSPMLARNKLCILPRVLERHVTEQQSRSGGMLFYTVLKVEFDLVSAEDGSKHTICTVGEAMDSGDKSSNKAMSAAFKYACFQAFCIPTEGENDGDAQTYEVRSKAQILADRFVRALETEMDGPVMDVHIEANPDKELYSEAWKLLKPAARAAIKAAIERAKVPNTMRAVNT